MKRGAKRLWNNPSTTTKQARCRFGTVGQSPWQEREQDGWREPGDAQQQQRDNGRWGHWVEEWQIAVVSGGSSPVDGKRKVDIVISSQTLCRTINGTIGSILGLCGKTYAFLAALQRAMDAIVKPVGNLSQAHYRA